MRKWTVVGLLALVGSILLVPMALGQDSTVKVRATWAPPSTEEFSEPVLYRIEIRFRVSKDAPKGFWGEVGTSTEPTYDLTFDEGMCYEVRVRAQDAAGLLGDYSVLSEEMCVPEGESQETTTKDEPLPPDDIQGPYKQDE